MNKGLLIKYVEGNCSDSEMVAVTEWIDSSPENMKEYAALRKLYDMTIWQASSQSSIKAEEKKLIRNYFIRSYKIVAVFILTISLSSLITYIVFNKKPDHFLTANSSLVFVSAPFGSRAMTILSDGTKVWLNAGSNLKYETNFNTRTRIVKLEGEAFFDVKTNPKKPFVVESKGISIKAYGTAFNVKAYNDEKEVITTLIRGKVYIEGTDKQDKHFALQMKPYQSVTLSIDSHNQQHGQSKLENEHNLNSEINAETKSTNQFNGSKIKIDSDKTELYTSWKDNRWIFRSEKLKSLARKLERRYDVEIIFKDEEMGNYTFSGSLYDESIEQVFEALKIIAPIDYHINHKKIEISLNKLLKVKYENIKQ
jgi:ferric-dicitrate binding protein FerR (iron transport regulator)